MSCWWAEEVAARRVATESVRLWPPAEKTALGRSTTCKTQTDNGAKRQIERSGDARRGREGAPCLED